MKSEKIIKLYRQGKTYQEIKTITGLDSSKLANIMNKLKSSDFEIHNINLKKRIILMKTNGSNEYNSGKQLCITYSTVKKHLAINI